MPFDVPLGGSPIPPSADYAFLSDCEVTALVAPSENIDWMCLPRMDVIRADEGLAAAQEACAAGVRTAATSDKRRRGAAGR